MVRYMLEQCIFLVDMCLLNKLYDVYISFDGIHYVSIKKCVLKFFNKW
jgi:hypothetical protein